jgi:hypothetical protein
VAREVVEAAEVVAVEAAVVGVEAVEKEQGNFDENTN